MIDLEGFVTDEAGANRESIRIMLKPGAADRSKSCELHFYECARRQEKGGWSEASKVKFRKLVHGVYHASTPGQYEACRRKMLSWASEKPSKRGHIKNWYQGFWNKRRCHVFRAFKNADAPNTNMAEAAHSRNATRG